MKCDDDYRRGLIPMTVELNFGRCKQVASCGYDLLNSVINSRCDVELCRHFFVTCIQDHYSVILARRAAQYVLHCSKSYIVLC